MAAPANDDFADALLIEGCGGTTDAITIDEATTEPGPLSPVFRAGTSDHGVYTFPASTFTIDKPAGTTDGDLLYLVVVGAVTSDPVGWNSVFTGDPDWNLYYKVASSEPASWDIDLGTLGGDAPYQWVCGAWSGAQTNGANGVDFQISGNSGTSRSSGYTQSISSQSAESNDLVVTVAWAQDFTFPVDHDPSIVWSGPTSRVTDDADIFTAILDMGDEIATGDLPAHSYDVPTTPTGSTQVQTESIRFWMDGPAEPFGSNVGSANQTVWFKWVATDSGSATFDTHQSTGDVASSDANGALDTTLSVWTGTALDDLVEVASNDDFDTSNDHWWSSVTFTATAAETYWIQVGTFSIPYVGSVVLDWDGCPSVPADWWDVLHVSEVGDMTGGGLSRFTWRGDWS